MKRHFLIALVISLPALAASEAGPLRAGAARVDITPAEGTSLQMAGYAARKEGHKGVHDRIYTRAIVVDNGRAKGAIIVCDVLSFSHSAWDRITDRVSSEAGIPRENIFLAATHTHGAPSLRASESYFKTVEDSVLHAVLEAQKGMQPARVGAGTGRANVNVNRRALMADGTWYLGINPDGPSDKTVAVVKFETASGAPIALLVNYAVHGTGMGQDNYLITGDVPGVTSAYVERHMGQNVVVLWTSGAGGDQCPIYDRSPRSFDGVLRVGKILGDEVMSVAGAIQTTPRVTLRSAQSVVTCPGQRLTPGPRRRQKYEFLDGDPVDIRLSLLQLNDIALTGVSGEVLTMIGQRLKRDSRLPHAVMITHCNGSSGYLPDDAAYENVSYEIYTARVKKGCAENAIVNGLLKLMGQQ